MENVYAAPSKVHGQGLFARVAIPAGARVIEYTGEKISKSESLRRCQQQNYYIFSLDDDWDIDGSVEWNLARFANHSCEPNCETDIIDGHIWIVSLREIAAGEEITYNYTYDLDEYREHPCRCGMPSCVGYIVAEEFFPTVRQAMSYAQPHSTAEASVRE
jgi:hypothetical protein